MYFANMYCFGNDYDTVGITGIQQCLGVVYVGDGVMYAIHIPFNGTDAEDERGCQAFADYVRNNAGKVGDGHGDLFAFANGASRPTAESNVRLIKKLLKSPDTMLYRINKHLGPNSGKNGALAVVVMVKKTQKTAFNPSALDFSYKPNDDIKWITGGRNESGQYKENSGFKGNKIPNNCNAGWHRLDETNSSHEWL